MEAAAKQKMAAPTRFVSPNAEVVSKTQALMVNVAAARGLQNVLKTNLGEGLTLHLLFARCISKMAVSENTGSILNVGWGLWWQHSLLCDKQEPIFHAELHGKTP